MAAAKNNLRPERKCLLELFMVLTLSPSLIVAREPRPPQLLLLAPDFCSTDLRCYQLLSKHTWVPGKRFPVTLRSSIMLRHVACLLLFRSRRRPGRRQSVNPGAGRENSPGLRVPPSTPEGRTGTRRHAGVRRRPSAGHRRQLAAAHDESPLCR